jgi:hypothetical protein
MTMSHADQLVADHRRWAPLFGLAMAVLLTSWLGAVVNTTAPSDTTMVVGQVVDQHGPVPGATVRFQGDAQHTLTDTDGRFSLTRTDGDLTRVTASKEGYLIRGADLDQMPLRIVLAPLPPHATEGYQWVDPTPHPDRELSCGRCHPQIHQEWLATSHANSVTNRRFINLYDGTDWHGHENVGWNLMKDYPDGVSICTPCHAPSVEFDDPAMFDLRRAEGVAALGIHCDFCHKIQQAPTDALGLAHGRDGLKLLLPAKGQVFFGSMDDVDTGEASYAPVYAHSRVCASCHEGVVFGVHVYSTYSEWLDSPAAQQGQHCQTCHMTPTGQMQNMAPGHGGIDRDPMTLASHRDAGQRADRLRDCLDVVVTARGGSDKVRVAITIRLRNVGHAMPTGFIDRHLILHVEGLDQNGDRLHWSDGPLLPAVVGSLAGRPGRLYAKQTCGFDGKSPAPFWQARSEVVDTRLVPDRDERAEFTFPPKTARVRVRLVYRRFWEEVARQKQWPNDAIVVFDRQVQVHRAPSPSGGHEGEHEKP